MIIWCEEITPGQREAWQGGGAVLGSFGPCRGGVCLLEAGNGDVPEQPGMHWYVPAGRGGDTALIEGLKRTGLPLWVCLNGLGSASLQYLREQLKGCEYHLCYDARGTTEVNFNRQLSWLANQPEPFGVLVEQPDRAARAATCADGLVLVGEARAMLGEIDTITRLRREGAARPLAPDEIDALTGLEASLTVARPLEAGTLLEASQLAVAVTAERGIAPYLAESLAGMRLRYPVRPGEPITFGMLEDASHE